MPLKRMKGNKNAKRKRRKKKRVKEEEVPTVVYTKQKILELQKRVIESYGQVYDLRVRSLHLRVLTEAEHDEIETLQQDYIDYQETMKARTQARGALVTEAKKRLAIEVARAEQQRQEQVTMIAEKMKQLEMEKMEHEAKLERIKILLIDMEPFGIQKQQQKDLIKQLKADLKNLKIQQDEELNKEKTDFVRVRKEIEKKYNTDIDTVKKAANKMIGPFLELKLNEIRQSNTRLSNQLYWITNRQKALTATKAMSSSRRDAVIRTYHFWEGIDRPSRKTDCVTTDRKNSLLPLDFTFSVVSSCYSERSRV